MERQRPEKFPQTEAARLAGVSLATWRRFENDPASVSAQSRNKCQKALEKMAGKPGREARMDLSLARLADQLQEHWGDRHFMTPRQAALMTTALGLWDDERFLYDELSENGPFDMFAPTVMMHVHNNRPWAKAVYDRCKALHDLLTQGVNPLHVPHSFVDEVLMVAACREAGGLEELYDEEDDSWLPEPCLPEGGDIEGADFEDIDIDDIEAARMFDDEGGWADLEENILEIAKHDDEVEAVLGDDLLFGDAPRHPLEWFAVEELWYTPQDNAHVAAGAGAEDRGDE